MKIIYLALPVFLYALGYAHAADGNNGTGQDNKKTYVIHSDDQHSYAEEIGPNGKYFLLLNSMNKKGIDQFLHQQPNSADVLLDRSAANLKWKPSNFKFIKIPEAAQSASAEQPGGQVDKGVSTAAGNPIYKETHPYWSDEGLSAPPSVAPSSADLATAPAPVGVVHQSDEPVIQHNPVYQESHYYSADEGTQP